MLTRRELDELYDEGSEAVARVIAELYDYIAANEPPIVRRQRMSIEALSEIVRVKGCDPASALVHRLQNRREQVLRFMTDFSVPFGNNVSERERPHSQTPAEDLSLFPHTREGTSLLPYPLRPLHGT